MTRRFERSQYEVFLGESSPESRSPRWLGTRDSRLFRTACFLATLLLAAVWAVPARAAEPALKTLQYSDVQEGTRVRVTRTVGRPIVGTVLKCTPETIRLDLGADPSGLNVTVEFRANSITKIELLKDLSEAELKALRAEREDRAERAREVERAKAAPQGPSKTTSAGETPGESAGAIEPRPVLTEAQAAMLRSFPPDQWGADRLAEIRRRWIVIGLAPNQTESAFVTIYPQWVQAVAQLEALRRWEAEHRDVILLENFPPKEGWSPAKHDALAARQAAGGVLTETEAGFLQAYPEWLKAYEALPKSKKPAGKVETPSEKAPEEPKAEKPVEAAPAKPKDVPPPEPAAEKPVEKPADKPAEKPADVPAVPVPAPDQTQP